MNASVPDRDEEFEKKQNEIRIRMYIKKFLDRMALLDQCSKDFVHDNTYHNIDSGHHIAYKYKVGKDGETILISKDGKRGYEFILEFDKEDFGYGIYYGCRALILDGDQEEQINKLIAEWEESGLKEMVCTVLNNTFDTIDFTNRFQLTTNANNRTFWPFWISLYEGEDIIEVGARATKLIGEIYKEFIDNNDAFIGTDKGNCCHNGPKAIKARKKAVTIKTSFTNDAYDNILAYITEKTKDGIKNRMAYEQFIKYGLSKGFLIEDRKYEKAYRFRNYCDESITNDEISFIFKEISGKVCPEEQGLNTRWGLFTPVFLSASGHKLDSISKANSRFCNGDSQMVYYKEKVRALLVDYLRSLDV